MKSFLRNLLFVLLLITINAFQLVRAQFLMDMIDTTTEVGKGLLSIYKKYDRIRIGGYMQPQFQAAGSKGAKSYNGGDFPANSNNRFMLRRGRIRFEYVHFSDNTRPSVQFVFQFDGTERGVFIRDFYGRIYENNLKLFALATGMFARPFGYEVNLSSSDRESPERGRVSQILMKTERDLGAMISFEPRDKTNWLQYVKLDAGLFNGQGLTTPGEYDSFKDLISRAGMKPYPLDKDLLLSAGISLLQGGLIQNNKFVYTTQKINGDNKFIVDSSTQNVGRKLPRKYYGADVQLKWLHKGSSATELRAEYWYGTQTGSQSTSETPSSLFTVDSYYVRKFHGAFFYLLHSFDRHNQVLVKYDWYDPNTKVKENEIGLNNGTHSADIRYNTFGLGYIHYFDENFKLLAWYELVKNDSSSLPDYTSDLEDNVFTVRIQYRF